MTTLGTYDLLLFDGDCGVCSKSAEIARRIARRSGYQVEPYQRYSEEELAPLGLDYARCSKRVKAITRHGRVLSGAFAVNHFCWRHPAWAIIPIVIYLLPPLLLAELILYDIVAYNRQRISRWLGLTACAIPGRPIQKEG